MTLNQIRFWGGVALTILLAGALAYAGFYIDRKAVERTDNKWKLAVADLNLKAEKELGLLKDKVAATEQQLGFALTAQERKDRERDKVNESLRLELKASRALNGGRMRDPNAKAECRGSGGDSASAPVGDPGKSESNPAETGGLLSAELTGLLDRLTFEADDINSAYASCREDAINIRALLSAPAK